MAFSISGGISRDSVIVGAVEKVRQRVIDDLVNSLDNSGATASGELEQSIDVKYKLEDSKLIVSIVMEDYWKFVDKGVKGTRDEKAPNSPYSFKSSKDSIPPNALSGINGWIAAKGVSLTGIATHYKNKNGKKVKRKKSLTNIQANKSLSFALGKSIHRKGIKPTNFYTNVVDEEWIKNFTKEMSKALAEDIKETIIQFD